jgi:hypothetical protein
MYTAQTPILALPCSIGNLLASDLNCFHLGWRPGTTKGSLNHSARPLQVVYDQPAHFGFLPTLRTSVDPEFHPLAWSLQSPGSPKHSISPLHSAVEGDLVLERC